MGPQGHTEFITPLVNLRSTGVAPTKPVHEPENHVRVTVGSCILAKLESNLTFKDEVGVLLMTGLQPSPATHRVRLRSFP